MQVIYAPDFVIHGGSAHFTGCSLTLPSFKLKFSLGFITSCYAIFSLSMVQAMVYIHEYITRRNKTERKL